MGTQDEFSNATSEPVDPELLDYMDSLIGFRDILSAYNSAFGHTFTSSKLTNEQEKKAQLLMEQCLNGERTKPVTDQELGLSYPEDANI